MGPFSFVGPKFVQLNDDSLISPSSSVRRQLLLLTAMSIALGLPLRDLVALVLGKSDLKSMFCLIVFSIVVLILGSSFILNPVLFVVSYNKQPSIPHEPY
jgi:hypothetical protein